MKRYVLGVDIGTYSSKGVLVALDGTIKASYTVNHGVEFPKPGFAEQDANKVWWHDFVSIVKALIDKGSINPCEILAVGVSGIGPCVLPIDSEGKPLRPGILYGIDTRATEEIEYLEEKIGSDKILEITGRSKLSSQAAGPKILWIKRHEPDVFQRARWFLTSQSYIVFRLTNRAVIDVYSAAGYAPLFDIFKRQWVQEIANEILRIECLPDVFWSYEIVGCVTKEAAFETGLLEGTPVVAGTTDAAAEAISVGMSGVGDMMLMVGSSTFFVVRTPELMRSQNFWVSNFVEPNFFTVLGGTSTAGSLTKWFRDQFGELEIEKEKTQGKDAYESLAELAEKSPVGSKGLVVLPYFAGERTPIHDPASKGIIFGLTLAHTKGDIYRSVLEGVSYSIRHNLQEMSKEGVVPQRILLAGGVLKNPLWVKLIADITGFEMNIPNQQIGASFGDAFLAAMGIKEFESVQEIERWVNVRSRVQPDASWKRIYDIKYQLYLELYKRTKDLMEIIHSLQVELSGITPKADRERRD
ncbi:MAG: Carbohydrate kinase FGGY [Thermotoga sp. 50_1627]|nr:MAG: Carbohydrate kinase FGGY [Thermotoga sp. 50_64]KUK24185.1 MAG: Carbohydrate kinase FGGY [Thermotoga sp. 50_1627]HBT39327.1 carbohydrate kinase [Pseudothermotoga sp.]HCO97543.1 carbohydrate kinase [Pseudothermotoga sp.]